MNMITKTSNYSIAAVEYAGMVSVSYVKRSGLAIKCGLVKVGTPVKRVTTIPFVYWGQKLDQWGKGFKRKNIVEEHLIAISEKLDQIDRRLAGIERGGISVVQRQAPVKEKKKLNDGKKLLLKAIVSENILLRDDQKGNQ